MQVLSQLRGMALDRSRAAAEMMFSFRELVHANKRQLAELITLEHGKTLPDAIGEVSRGLENIEFACGIPNLLKGGFTEQASRGIDVYQIRQPLGVVAGITPFNFPAMVPLWMFPNAIACGNTFILKPSEKDPSVSLLLAELMQKAGVPDGIFNVIQGRSRGRGYACSNIRMLKRSALLVPRPSRGPFMKRATRNGKRVQALGRGEKSHDCIARRGYRNGCGRGCFGGVRFSRRAVHGDLYRNRGRQRGRSVDRGNP